MNSKFLPCLGQITKQKQTQMYLIILCPAVWFFLQKKPKPKPKTKSKQKGIVGTSEGKVGLYLHTRELVRTSNSKARTHLFTHFQTA